MNSEKLKPCPFCGGQAEYIQEGRDSYVYCKECSTMTDLYVNKIDTINAWNTRESEKVSRRLIQAMCDIRDEKIACRQEDNSPAFMMALAREDNIYKQAKAFLQHTTGGQNE